VREKELDLNLISHFAKSISHEDILVDNDSFENLPKINNHRSLIKLIIHRNVSDEKKICKKANLFQRILKNLDSLFAGNFRGFEVFANKSTKKRNEKS